VNGRKGLSGRDDAFFILVQYYSSITCGHFGLDAGGAHYWCKRVTMKAMRGRGDRQTGTLAGEFTVWLSVEAQGSFGNTKSKNILSTPT
jgi:hypothetical protein